MNSAENIIPRKKREDWKNLIHNWLKSNFSISEFCNLNNLSQSTFHYWRAKFGSNNKRIKKSDTINEPKFVPIEVALAPTKVNENHNVLILQYPNGCSVRINKIFDPNLLQLINVSMGIKLC